MKNLTIYTLEGCSACENFKQNLKSKHLQYKEISCSREEKTCDKEIILMDNDRYPFCKLDAHNIQIYVCITLDSSRLGVINKINDKTVVYYVDSQINIVNTILKL